MAENAKKSWLEKAMDKFTGGEEGQFKKFRKEFIKSLESENALCTRNIGTLKFNFENDIEEIKTRIEEAVEVIEESYLNVNISKIKEIDDRKEFMKEFKLNIARKLAVKDELEKSLKNVTETYEKKVKEQEAIIEVNKFHMEKLK
jgi:hypothetical protein